MPWKLRRVVLETWLNQLKGFPTLPSSFETSTKRGMVKPVKRFSNPPLFF
jgi:hypothetical protein